MIRLLVILVCICAIDVACTTRQEREARDAGGTAAQLFGLPRAVGEGLAGSVIAIMGLVAGHKHGRKKERKATSDASKARAAAIVGQGVP